MLLLELSQHPDGPGSMSRLLLEHLDPGRYEPWLAVGRAAVPGCTRQRFPLLGLPDLPAPRPGRRWPWNAPILRFTPRLARWAARHEIALIHSDPASLALGGLAARLAGAASVATPGLPARPGAFPCTWGPFAGLLTDRLLPCLEVERLALRERGYPGRSLRIVPICTDLLRFRPVDRTVSGRGGPPVLGVWVQGLPGPALERLIETFALLRRRECSFAAVLLDDEAGAGRGLSDLPAPLQSRLQEPWLGRRTIAGSGGAAERRAVLGELDVFVLPAAARTSLHGLQTCLEAMAMELPVIACRDEAAAEVVADRVTGLLVPPDSPAALARALELLLDDPARRRALGRAGRERVAARFDVRGSARLLMEAYDELLAERDWRTRG